MTARKEFLLSLYSKMLLIRLVEEAIARRYHEQEMRCPVHLSIGQEAAASGACQHLLATDVVSSAHRSHAHYLAKGGSVRAMLAELYGKAEGCAGGRGGSMHLLDLDAGVLPCLPIIGTSISTGVGAAFSFKQRKQNSVSMIFLGDAAVEEGIFHEAANFASIKNLPVVFVCENNFYSVCTPLDVRQPQRPITELAQAHELHTAHADGNDGLAVQEIAKAAIDQARNGEGPSFLLLETYRMREHCGPLFDQEMGYRTDEEYNEWLEKCPIKRHFAILENELNWTAVDDEAFCQAIRDDIDDAFDFAIKAPFPAQETAGLHVYAK